MAAQSNMNQVEAAIANLTMLMTQQAEREQATNQTKGLNDFRRQDPPKFSRGFDPEEADLWLRELEKFFKFLQTLAPTMVSYATYLLTGEAEHWWYGARAMLEADHQAITWESFKKAFLNKYFPRRARALKEREFLDLHQKGMTVAEYGAKLESLSKHFRYFRGKVDEEYMCERFLDGLRYDLQRALQPLGIERYPELVQRAQGIEALDNQEKGQQSSSGPTRSHQGRFDKGKKPYQRPLPEGRTVGSTRPIGGNLNFREQQNSLEEVLCFKCNKKGHYANNCTAKPILCWNCNIPGHLAKDCTRPKVEGTMNVVQGRRPTTRGRVYTISGVGADDTESL